jgi:hypothetical protein
MSKDEALDLALEALRSAAAELYRASSYCNTYEVLGNTNDAITAIQQARLAQPAPVQEPVAWAMYQRGRLQSFWLDKGDAYDFEFTSEHEWKPLYTTPPAAPVQEPVIDHSCKDTYELIMKWADIYAAQTGELYSQAAQDPSKAARMADERTMLACVVAQALSQPAASMQRREHITDGSPCWCNPETDYVDPKTNAAVIVHKEPQ